MMNINCVHYKLVSHVNEKASIEISAINVFILKWLITQKFDFIVGFPPSVQDFFVILHVPFCIFLIDFLLKGDTLWNFKS